LHFSLLVSLHDDDFAGKYGLRLTEGVPSPSLTPDRRRIDSDVRAFLRQPSTPWITFDRDGRPSQLAAGEVLTSGRSSILLLDAFPTSPAAHVEPVVEPSSLVVASDVVEPSPGAGTPAEDANVDDAPRTAKRRSALLGGAVALTAAALTVAVSFVSAGGAKPDVNAVASRRVAAAAAVTPDAPPPDLGTANAGSDAAKARVADAPVSKEEKPASKRFGRLTIAGAARQTNVYLDGKRLLGAGGRSFVVFCGPHQVAVGNKADAREVDIPCNAELVVSR